jgi:hypothetical protein
MTTNKAQKRAVRARMSRTGESYTAARRQVLQPQPLPPRQAEPEVSDVAVLEATGRRWDDWFRLLDDRGLEDFSHRETARWLVSTHQVDGWWAQSITVGYERARGLRKPHQTSEGFEVSVSKTLPVPADALWAAVADPTLRADWVGDLVLEERTLRASRYARFEVPRDGTRVLMSVDPKGDAKSTLTVTHARLSDGDAVEARRALWRERLAVLATRLTADAG